jgi:hypothetical protein
VLNALLVAADAATADMGSWRGDAPNVSNAAMTDPAATLVRWGHSRRVFIWTPIRLGASIHQCELFGLSCLCATPYPKRHRMQGDTVELVETGGDARLTATPQHQTNVMPGANLGAR